MANKGSAAFSERKNFAKAESVRRSDNGLAGRQLKVNDRSNIAMNESERRAGSAISIFLTAVLSFAMLGSVIYSLDKRNNLYSEIAEKTTELTALEAENVRLQSERDSNMTLKNVEEYAETVLGMQKLDRSQIEYIQIQTEDEVNIPPSDENIWVKIKKIVDECVEYLRG